MPATPDVTPALRQAAQLRALATHLTQNPHLASVNVTADKLQVPYHRGPGAALLAWADTLTNPEVTVTGNDGDAFVYVTGSITVGTVTVWTVVPGFLSALDMTDDDCYRRPVELDTLRSYVTGRA